MNADVPQAAERSAERFMASVGMQSKHGYVADAEDCWRICLYGAWHGPRPDVWEGMPLEWRDNMGPISVGPALS